MADFRFIDLFCGIGGFHQAMVEMGGECVYASDNDLHCQRVYADNYGMTPGGDITKVDEKDIPAHDVLCAGFPCQSFSKAGKRLGFLDQTKGTLFFDVMRIVNYHKPRYVLLENVRNLASHDGGNTWKVIHDALSEAGYDVSDTPAIFSPHYIGIPQHRERVFIMAVRKDVGSLHQFWFETINAKESNISSVLSQVTDMNYSISQELHDWMTLWNMFINGISADRLPGFPIWTAFFNDAPVLGLSEMPSWKRTIIEKNKNLWREKKGFLRNWLRTAATNPLFFGAKAKFEWQAGDTRTPDIWKQVMQIRPSGLRVSSTRKFPALVAITQIPIISVNGQWPRYLTPRECARLQSFPESFKCDPSDAQAYKQFGNAVNVELVKLFAGFMFGNADLISEYSKENQQISVIPDFDKEIPEEKEVRKFKKGDVVSNGEYTYTINYIGRDCYWVKEHDCATIPFEYEEYWEIVK